MTEKAFRLKAYTATEETESEKQHVELTFVIKPDNMVTVYRKKIEGMIFDFDEEEYFDDFSPSEGDCIYQGFPEITHCFGKICDFDVETGATYAYWVKTENSGGRITGPVGVKVRDPKVWWHYDKIMDRMYALENAYENVSCVSVGETVAHKPLVALFAGNRDHMIAATGAIHAAESGPEILLSCVEYLLKHHSALLEKVGIAILPSVNADMREEVVCGLPKYYRVNKNGVDLNRNFSANWEEVGTGYGLSTDDPKCETYRGPYPFSEPETKAVAEFIRITNPKVILSYHALACITGDGMLCAKSMADDKDRVQAIKKLAMSYSGGFRSAAQDPTSDPNIPYPHCSAGSLGEWSYQNGYFSLDLELWSGGCLDYFADAKKDLTTLEMLERNILLHQNGIVSLMTYLSENT